jgi:glycosyl transferase family 87
MKREQAIRFTAVLLIVGSGVAYAWFSFPAGREDQSRLLDFSEFYAAAKIVRQGLGHSLYDLKLQAEFQLEVAPVHAFYLRPPFEALVFIPYSYLGYRSAYMAWLITSLAALLLAVWLIRNHSNILAAMLQYTHGIPVDLGLTFVLFLTFGPTMNCLLIGQDAIFILLIYTLVFRSLKQGREAEAGCILACGLFKYHLVLPFAIIFAMRRRKSFLKGFAALAVALIALSVFISGFAALKSYPAIFMNTGYRRLMSFQPEYAANLHGLVYLLTRDKIPGLISAAIIVALSLTLLWVTAKKWEDSQLELCFSAAVVAALLTGFHAFVYDLSVLLLPIALACGELAKGRELFRSSTLNLSLLILFLPPVHHLLAVYHVYALMGFALLSLFFVIMRAISRTTSDKRLGVSA